MLLLMPPIKTFNAKGFLLNCSYRLLPLPYICIANHSLATLFEEIHVERTA